MPLSVTCPRCAKAFSASQPLEGKGIICPHCKGTLRVSSPPAEPRDAPVFKGRRRNLAAAAEPEAAAAVPVAPRPSDAATLATAGDHGGTGPGVQQSAAPPAGQARTAKPASADRARFIAGRVAQREQLGADGRLPELVLEGEVRKEVEAASSVMSHPLLLLGVLSLSITLSVVMLFVSPTVSSSHSANQQEARRQLELYLAVPGQPMAPFGQSLREALQAHNRGDRAQERRRYREVLDLLHCESGTSLVDPRRYPPPLADAHLEEQLLLLLRDE